MKAGKSTLLNALVGEVLAPTDAGECTRIVTWYVDGIAYRVTLHPIEGGAPRQVPFTRDDGAIACQLGDTPARAHRPARDRVAVVVAADDDADRHAGHRVAARVDLGADARLPHLERRPPHARRRRPLPDAPPPRQRRVVPRDVPRPGVLAADADQRHRRPQPRRRGRRRTARRHGVRPADRRPLPRPIRRCGGCARRSSPSPACSRRPASTLRESEFRAFDLLRQAPPQELDDLLLSADRFVHGTTSTGLAPMERERLLERFGLYGVRMAIALLAAGETRNSTELADALVAHSGLTQLEWVLRTQFAARADVLKARSALLGLQGAAAIGAAGDRTRLRCRPNRAGGRGRPRAGRDPAAERAARRRRRRRRRRGGRHGARARRRRHDTGRSPRASRGDRRRRAARVARRRAGAVATAGREPDVEPRGRRRRS